VPELKEITAIGTQRFDAYLRRTRLKTINRTRLAQIALIITSVFCCVVIVEGQGVGDTKVNYQRHPTFSFIAP
jgi:hypothetical protein